MLFDWGDWFYGFGKRSSKLAIPFQMMKLQILHSIHQFGGSPTNLPRQFGWILKNDGANFYNE